MLIVYAASSPFAFRSGGNRSGVSTVDVHKTRPDLRECVPANHLAHFSYQRTGEMIAQLELEVQQLLAKAEQADATRLEDGSGVI
jgi:hypothetical protein